MTILPETKTNKDISSLIKSIKAFANSTNKKDFSIDLCGINMFSAIKTASIISTYGIIYNPHITFKILTENNTTKEHIQLLGLNNVKVDTKAKNYSSNLVIKV